MFVLELLSNIVLLLIIIKIHVFGKTDFLSLDSNISVE